MEVFYDVVLRQGVMELEGTSNRGIRELGILQDKPIPRGFLAFDATVMRIFSFSVN